MLALEAAGGLGPPFLSFCSSLCSAFVGAAPSLSRNQPGPEAAPERPSARSPLISVLCASHTLVLLLLSAVLLPVTLCAQLSPTLLRGAGVLHGCPRAVLLYLGGLRA